MKIFAFGPAGSGKTTALIQFPYNYIIDTEQGTDPYYKTIQEKHSKVFKSTNPLEIEEEIDYLTNEKHEFKTVSLDCTTELYDTVLDIWHDKFVASQKLKNKGKEDLLEDFGVRFWQKAKPTYKKILRKLKDLPMNVIVTAHEKDKYRGQSIIGVTFDSEKSDDFMFDFVFRFFQNNGVFKAVCLKQRNDKDEVKFPYEEFDWHYNNLIQFANKRLIDGNIISNKPYEVHTEVPINKKQEEKNTNQPIKTELQKPNNNDLPWEQKEQKTSRDVKLEELFKRLEKAEIQRPRFCEFVNKEIGWEIKSLQELSEHNLDLLLENWKEKILVKYKQVNKQINKQNTPPKELNEKEKFELEKKEKIKEIKDKLVQNNISNDIFISFIKKVVKWDHVKSIDTLESTECIKLLANWNAVLDKLKTENTIQNHVNNINEQVKKPSIPQVINPDDKITDEQKAFLIRSLGEYNKTEKDFLISFGINNMDSITQEGANNMINHFDTIVSDL